MTRRARILTALSRGVPDRPPIAFDSRPGALDVVLRHYGAKDKNDLYTIAGIDGFSVWEWNAVMGKYVGPPKTAPDGTELDFWGNQSQHRFGLAACGTVDELRRHRWPQTSDFDFSHVYARALEIKSMDMAVSAGHLGLGYQMHNMLRGNENALFDLFDERYMGAYMERLTAFTLEYIEALLAAGRGEIDVVRADDDIGTMDRLMLSPEMWRKYYKPAWRAAFDTVHRHGAKVWFHSCGHVAPLLDDLVEIGIDCWNPFPQYVKGNDHAWLKRWRLGGGRGVRKIALDGGVDHPNVLVRGTPQMVIDETRRVLDTFAPDGGLLIGPSQVFTEDIPPENTIAFFETALRG
ncbi:MAG TPA: uroporphyrinogen decarboxylase family protein [Planctomycetota bacterium]|nr:uroporphyrinogen decarboxylase family protein [Planctomycetota bacterium]